MIHATSCTSSKALILNQPLLTSYYMENKIERLQKSASDDLESKRKIAMSKIEYSGGIIMEEADRLVDLDYSLGLEKYKKSYALFLEAKDDLINILLDKYPDFQMYLENKTDLNFKAGDISDLYWLAVAYGGCIYTSRGNPFELVNIPKMNHLIRDCLRLDPDWRNGALYSMMMSVTNTRSDLSEQMHRDTLKYYFDKVVLLSDSMNASSYVSYAESVHKKYQEKKEFKSLLEYVLDMEVYPNTQYELTNLIAKRRAKWLLARSDEYFVE